MSNCRVIAICNQKGGVGKTTTTVNLGIGLAMQEKRVLLVDGDPQADLTASLGWRDSDNLPVTLSTKLMETINEASIQQSNPYTGILHHSEGAYLIPSNIELAGVEQNLYSVMRRESVLKFYLDKVKKDFDYILIDCMPSLGMLTINALSAADSVIIPVQAQFLPAKGMTQLLQTVHKVKKFINPEIKIDGILLTLVDSRTNLARNTIETIQRNFGSHIRIYRTNIPVAVKAAEVSSMGKSIYAYDPNGTVAKAYAELTKEVLSDGERTAKRTPAPEVR